MDAGDLGATILAPSGESGVLQRSLPAIIKQKLHEVAISTVAITKSTMIDAKSCYGKLFCSLSSRKEFIFHQLVVFCELYCSTKTL